MSQTMAAESAAVAEKTAAKELGEAKPTEKKQPADDTKTA
jgi:hypothetical protein